MSSDDRRRDRSSRAKQVFGNQAEVALDALALLDWAWHDCHGESSPTQEVMDDIWVVADGDLARFITAIHLAVLDYRDLRLSADAVRGRGA